MSPEQALRLSEKPEAGQRVRHTDLWREPCATEESAGELKFKLRDFAFSPMRFVIAPHGESSVSHAFHVKGNQIWLS